MLPGDGLAAQVVYSYWQQTADLRVMLNGVTTNAVPFRLRLLTAHPEVHTASRSPQETPCIERVFDSRQAPSPVVRGLVAGPPREPVSPAPR